MDDEQKAAAIEDLKRWLLSKRETPEQTVADYNQPKRIYTAKYINQDPV